MKTQTVKMFISAALVFAPFLQGNLCSQPLAEESLYLGQIPPGDTPEIFPLAVKPGCFAAERIAISKENADIYYSEIQSYYPVRGATIKRYSFANGKWNGPSFVFEGFAAAFSVTGDTMYFERMIDENVYTTYISERNGHDWGDPKRIFAGLNKAHYYQVTGTGKHYISSEPEKGAGLSDWCRVMVENGDTTALSLGVPLNTRGDNLDFFVSGDESFMIVANRPDLAISYRKDDGSWTNPVSLGRKINFGLGSWGPWITPDNKYLFYTTGTKPDYSDVFVYWVRIDNQIDSIKKTVFNSRSKE